MPHDPIALARDLLGAEADEIAPLLVWPDRAAYRVTIGAQQYVIKSDDDHDTVAREIAGHRRAGAAGVRVPELVAATAEAFAMKWVGGIPLQTHSTADAWHDTGSQLRIAHDVGAGAPFGTGFGGFNPVQPTWQTFFVRFADSMIDECERELDLPAHQADRIRSAVHTAAPLLDTPHVVWCHGDLQPDHVLVDPGTARVTAIIDWADHGPGDAGWDLAVLTLDDASHLDAFFDGYAARGELRDAVDRLLPLYSVVRLVGEAGWLAEHGHPYADNLRRAIEWPL